MDDFIPIRFQEENVFIGIAFYFAQFGNSVQLISKTVPAVVYTKNVININPIIFMTMPIRTISRIRIYPLPKTIAFGGVATGNIIAEEAEIVAGIINSMGFILSAMPRLARIGRIVVAIAVLVANSVVRVIIRQIITIITIIGKELKTLNCSPNHEVRPDS